MTQDRLIHDEELADRLFKALASRPRRRILLMLASGEAAEDSRCCEPGEVCACVFSERLGLTAPTISHHMKVLQESGLVDARKEGLWVYYSLRPEAIAAVAMELGALMASCRPPGKSSPTSCG